MPTSGLSQSPRRLCLRGPFRGRGGEFGHPLSLKFQGQLSPTPKISETVRRFLDTPLFDNLVFSGSISIDRQMIDQRALFIVSGSIWSIRKNLTYFQSLGETTSYCGRIDSQSEQNDSGRTGHWAKRPASLSSLRCQFDDRFTSP